ncbi:MAG: M13 family metallopeptidase [Allomuricauda sp.]
MKAQKIRVCLAFSVVIGLSVSCKMEREPKEVVENTPGLNLAHIDTTIRPQDDIFRFMNGQWLEHEDIPADKSYWGVGPILHQQAQEDLLAIIEEANAKELYTKEMDQYKAIQLFNSVMDTVQRNEIGIRPLEPFIVGIQDIANFKDLQRELVKHIPYGIGMFFGYGVGPDRKNSAMNTLYLGPGALGLPERDYYLLQDKESIEIRDKYLAFINTHLEYIDYQGTDKGVFAQNVLELETQMAELMLTKEERRDARNTYHPMTIQDLTELSPVMDWNEYLASTELNMTDTLVVTQPDYFKGLDGLLRKTDLPVLKHYMLWTLLNATNNVLSMELERINWEFYSKELNGSKEQRPLEERALSIVNNNIGEALGKVYVDKKFPEEAKAKAKRLVDNLLAAFETRIENLDWMTSPTKEKAKEKLKNITVKIGYPDKWLDYSDLAFKEMEQGGSLFDYMFELARWNHQLNLNELNKPVDKTRWLMTPQEVNAYFYPPNNEIVFPAAILQPPYFNYQADMAVNYGGIGGIIGHEISHAFDDSGSRFDAQGNLNNWWQEEDAERFSGKTKALVDEFNNLEPLPGIRVNGEFTLGENIGDLGGLNAAFDALQLDLKTYGNPGKIDGYTQEERFFLAWAGSWKQKMRDEFLKTIIKTDPHSPGEYRANIPVRHMDVFHETFRTMPGDGMYVAPEDRIKIW